MSAGKRVLASTLAVLVLAGWHPAGRGEPYPGKPVKIIVGAAPGGPADFLARLFSEGATKATGQAFTVENRPGASGILAAQAVAKAQADGHTLLASGPGTMVVAPHLFANLGFDATRDFVPVAMLGVGGFVLAVHHAVPARTLEELIELARARPKALAVGSGGIGSAGHLSAELFASLAGIRLNHAPYKGDAQAFNDLLGGQIQLVFAAPNVVLPRLQSGSVRVLAVTGKDRLAALPLVPTMDEAGLKGYESLGWIALFAPAGTPRQAIETLARAWNDFRAQAATTARLQALGMASTEERFSRPNALAEFLESEASRTSRLLRDVEITAN